MFESAAAKRITANRSGTSSLIYFALLISLGFDATGTPLTVRSYDGSGNNLANDSMGAANTPLYRLLDPAYEDGLSIPRGGGDSLNSTLPSARAVSNAISSQTGSTPSAAGISSWFWQWGQFVDHDIDLTGTAEPEEAFNIPVPVNDAHFAPSPTIQLERSVFDVDGNGVRQQTNQITAYIDASMIYGSDQDRASYLRTFDGRGTLKTTTGENGEILLPYNLDGLDNAMTTSADFFIAGDVRANEQLGLTAVHTLFVREHNRLAEELASRLNDTGNLDLLQLREATPLNDGDFIYEAVRKVVAAQIQKITYGEFLPLLLGDGAPGEYAGYDAAVNPAISNAFSAAAFRVGHTMLPSELYLANQLDPGNSAPPIELKDAFFNPAEIKENGVDSLLIGLLHQASQEIDTRIIDDVRNFLFGPPGAGGFDLAALNLQRGRDHGLPGYNEARAGLGLAPVASFLELTGDDQWLANAFAAVYDSIDAVDLWAGGLAELHYNGGLVGETFHSIIEDQFRRLRDGDRFFFMNPGEMSQLLLLDPLFMQDTSLSNIIERNTPYRGMFDAFQVAGVPAPGTLLLMLIGILGLHKSRGAFWHRTRASDESGR